MKTINLNLSKKLTPYLIDVETEYGYCDTRKSWKECNCYKSNQYAEMEFIPFKNLDEGDAECELILLKDKPYPNVGYNLSDPIKTLNLEEAIKFLPKRVNNGYLNINFNCSESIDLTYMRFHIDETFSDMSEKIHGKTLLIAIEKMLEYLLDNDLLPKVLKLGKQ